MGNSVTIRLPDGNRQTFHGREALTLRHLLNAGPAGITTLEQPAPRWSHYVFKLRKAGLVISTDREVHGGTYPGSHGRYRLETPVNVISEDAA